MAIQSFCPPSPPSPSPSHSHSPYYQLLERGSARLGRVKNNRTLKQNRYTEIVDSTFFWSSFIQSLKILSTPNFDSTYVNC